MDVLSAAVPMNVNVEIRLTLMVGTFYRILGKRVGRGYEEMATPIPWLENRILRFAIF